MQRKRKRKNCLGDGSFAMEKLVAYLMNATRAADRDDEHFNGPEPRKKILDFTVLVDPLRWTQRLCTYYLQCCGSAIRCGETFRLLAMNSAKIIRRVAALRSSSYGLLWHRRFQ